MTNHCSLDGTPTMTAQKKVQKMVHTIVWALKCLLWVPYHHDGQKSSPLTMNGGSRWVSSPHVCFPYFFIFYLYTNVDFLFNSTTNNITSMSQPHQHIKTAPRNTKRPKWQYTVIWALCKLFLDEEVATTILVPTQQQCSRRCIHILSPGRMVDKFSFI